MALLPVLFLGLSRAGPLDSKRFMLFKRPACGGLPVILGLAVLETAASAWGPTGHRVSAEIAQGRLAPEVATACASLLKGQSLADVANWADEIRTDSRYKPLEPLHYTNYAPGVRHYREMAQKPEADIVVAIRTLAQYLKSGDPAVLKALPALTVVPLDATAALKLLIHFVPDLHQPLHVGFLGEMGGNRQRVVFMKREHTNLHALWDESMLDFTHLSYTEFARMLERAFTPGKTDHGYGPPVEPEAWADESLAFHDQVYAFPDEAAGEPPTERAVGYKYVDANRDVVRQRLFEGGVRLAALLEWALTGNPKGK